MLDDGRSGKRRRWLSLGLGRRRIAANPGPRSGACTAAGPTGLRENHHDARKEIEGAVGALPHIKQSAVHWGCTRSYLSTNGPIERRISLPVSERWR